MQKPILLLVAICFSTLLVAQKSNDNFSGKWKTEGDVIIEITKSGSSFNGKPSKKNIFILKDLTFTNGKWIGVLTNPQKNISADCEAYLEANRIKFLAKKGIIKKEIYWTKEDKS
ncbi:MAG: hypothetical protein ACOYN9_15385 [Saprospiraceae bacterium]